MSDRGTDQPAEETAAGPRDYWDRVAGRKAFRHPLDIERLSVFAAPESSPAVIDIGCGDGRILRQLVELGYADLIGVDASAQMIRRAKRALPPEVGLHHGDAASLPVDPCSCDVAMMLSVLTSIPESRRQRDVVAAATLALKPEGYLFVSDLLLQDDSRNRARYARDVDRFGIYGVFELSDGGIMRHHDPQWFDELFSDFELRSRSNIPGITMNGNSATFSQMWWQRRSARSV